jgi:hypothetical protein
VLAWVLAVAEIFAAQTSTATETSTRTIARVQSPGLIVAAPEAPEYSSLVGEDVEPTIEILRTDSVELLVGGLVQLHAVPWVGSDALIENGDVATRGGFRLRRARFGLEGRFEKKLGILLAVNPLESDEDVGTVSDAKISYTFAPWAHLSAGAGKVPFSRGALLSSRNLPSIERPLVVTRITPSRRLGLTAEGRLFDGMFAYLAGVMNATEGFSFGNRFGGWLAGTRLEVAPFGAIEVRGSPGDAPSRDGVSFGASGLFEDGPSVTTLAASVDVAVAYAQGTLLVEGLCDRKTPVDAPLVAPGVADRVERCGAYAELGWRFAVGGMPFEAVVRGELFDDNTALDDTGDAVLIAGGINAELVPDYVRIQLHYLARRERFGGERENDAVAFALLGSF